MSLVGNLEDLGLGEILQIVSLSRKSGILTLHSRGREGEIVLRQGQVVRASATTSRSNIGDTLIQRKALDDHTLRRALEAQEKEGFRERLGTILIGRFGVPAEMIAGVVREQIEQVVYSLFSWSDGTFDFELSDNVDVSDNIRMDPLQFMLDQGINPQFLAMEGSRIMDEMRHRGEPEETSPDGGPPSPAPQPEETVDFAFNLVRAAESPAPPAPHPDKKPLVNLGDEIRLEMGEEPEPAGAAAPQSTGIALLRGMLEELYDPALGGGIILLVLRFASEFMNRAVVFFVKKDVIVGLGQFGIEDGEGVADSRVRNLCIPRGEDSLFNRVIETHQPAKVKPDDSPWNRYLRTQLGGGAPAEVFLGPIISEGKVVAVLYGDNIPEMRQVGDTDALEIFLSQAGLAMEKALLLRRLKGKGTEET